MTTLLVFLLLLQTEEVTTEHYRIVSTYRDAAYVKGIARTLESGYSKITALLDLSPSETEPYTVRLYATDAEYRQVDKEMNDGRFANNGSFSHPKTCESYILVQPRGKIPLMERMECLVYHEAFHLVVFRHAPWLQNSPAWLHEGLAERAGELVMNRRTLKFDSAVNFVRMLLDRGTWIPLADLLSNDESANADFIIRWAFYSEAWLLVKFLSEERKEAWKAFLKELQNASDRSPATTRALLQKATGKNLRELEEEWKGSIRAQVLPWIILDGDWRLTEDGIDGAAYPDSCCYLLSTTVVNSDRYTVSAEVKFSEQDSTQVDLVFAAAWDPRIRNLFKVSIVREGIAAVLTRRDGQWKRVAFEKVDPKKFPADRWLTFEVEVDRRTVRAKLDGEKLIEHTFPDETVEVKEVRWGLGNYDSFTHFRKMTLKK